MEVVQPEKTKYFMPYAPGIKVKADTDLLFMSGCTALPLYHAHPHDPADERRIPKDIKEQTRLVMDNIKRVLDSVGATFKDVVVANWFVTNMDEQDQIGQVMGEYFEGNFPCSTLVEVRRLVVEALRLEVEVVAEIPKHR